MRKGQVTVEFLILIAFLFVLLILVYGINSKTTTTYNLLLENDNILFFANSLGKTINNMPYDENISFKMQNKYDLSVKNCNLIVEKNNNLVVYYPLNICNVDINVEKDKYLILKKYKNYLVIESE